MLPRTGQRPYSHFMLDGWKVVFMVEAPIKVRVSGRVPAFPRSMKLQSGLRAKVKNK